MIASSAPQSTAGGATAPHDALLRTVLSVLTNVTVLTALLVYFGWKRSDVQARQLGLDETIFVLSTRDYLLRSVDALFVPLGVAAAVGLAWLWFDHRLRLRLDESTASSMINRGISVVTWSWLLVPALAFLVGVIAARFGALMVSRVAFPLSFGVGALLTVYAVQIRRELTWRRSGRPEPEQLRHLGIARGLVFVVVVLSVFWTLTNVAVSRGVALAAQIERNVDKRPAVVLHSTRPLGIDAPGVSEEQLAPDAYRYAGLRLLHHHDATFLLIHDGWTRTRGVLLLLTDEDGLRFEIVTGPQL